ncbi:PilW family protein [Pistricoccus aurantiacus]|uniref:PilW family protein n=1 Tax=Pistricoccus aurantiacus TaxID=1883414 RepID=UPI00362C0600
MKSRDAIPHKNQIGASLVELMISIVIGLLITFMVTSHYLSSRQSYQTTTVTSELLDEQRYAMQVITSQLLLAGYSDYWFNREAGFPALAAKDGAPSFGPGELVKSDSLSGVWLRFKPAALENQLVHGCLTGAIAEPVDSTIVMRLFVENEELRCQRRGENAETLLNNVDGVAFTYLDDSDEFQPLASANWPTVRAVKVELLLASGAETFDAPVAQKYAWQGGTRTFNDRRIRSQVSRIVALRNALGGR